MIDYKGQCLCGLITYNAPEKPKYIFNCHCTICRKRSGAPYTTWLIYKTDEVVISEEHLSYFESNPNVVRGFCKNCGTDISWKNIEKSNWIGVTCGTAKYQNLLTPSANIWVQSKLNWVQLDPNLKTYPRGPFE